MAATDAPTPGSTSGGSVFSLEDLDKIIESEDPNFKNEMANISAAASEVKAEIETLGIDSDVSGSSDTENLGANLKLTFKEKIITVLLRPWHWLKEIYAHKKITIKNKILILFGQIKEFFRYELPERLKYAKARGIVGAKRLGGLLSSELDRFKKLTSSQKIALAFVFIISVAAVFIFSRVYFDGLLPRFTDPLVHSLSDQAKFVSTYKDKSELQDLFEAFPQAEFNVLLTRVIVNLRPDSQSGPNPMGTYELYIGVDSQDTAIEIKDREKELMDIVQRVIESFSYSEVVTQMGKMRIKSMVRDRINEVLNQGRVLRVYFNTFITSP